MNHQYRRPGPGVPETAISVARLAALVLLVAGGWSLYLAAAAPAPAGAATLGGTATIVDPSGTALAQGGSATMFSVTLPAGAACSGDTATGGYHVYSYLVEAGTPITSLTFTSHPSTGFGLVNNTGIYYGPINTAVTTGQVLTLPTNFEWAPLLTDGLELSALLYSGSTGVWETGIACAQSSGTLSDYWNNEVTFAASSSDPNGFVWSDVPGTPGSTTTTTASGSTTTTTSGGATTTTSATTTTTSGGATTTTSATTTTTVGSTTTTTTTTTPSGGTTTTAAGSTTTDSTTTSIVGAVSGDTGEGASTASGDGSTIDDTTAASSSSLPFTGAPVLRDVVVGMLCVGVGLVLLGWSAALHQTRRRAVRARP
ncbi:MAG TPA: hypothetical protein VMB82_10240 [Acidimicrobiales bacterium]|nr:hypothetical protein [Acidimicrobiales bacterium]